MVCPDQAGWTARDLIQIEDLIGMARQGAGVGLGRWREFSWWSALVLLACSSSWAAEHRGGSEASDPAGAWGIVAVIAGRHGREIPIFERDMQEARQAAQELGKEKLSPRGFLKYFLLGRLKQEIVLEKLTQEGVDYAQVIQTYTQKELNGWRAQLGSEEALVAHFGEPLAQLKDRLSKQIREQLLLQWAQELIHKPHESSPQAVREYFHRRLASSSKPPAYLVGIIVVYPPRQEAWPALLKRVREELYEPLRTGELTFKELLEGAWLRGVSAYAPDAHYEEETLLDQWPVAGSRPQDTGATPPPFIHRSPRRQARDSYALRA